MDIIDMDITDITIRLAKPSDAADMAEVHMRSWEAAYKDIIPEEYIKTKNATRPDLFKRIITDENKTQYVIQADGKTVGIMCIAPPKDDDVDDNYYELHGIYLHPDYYRRGIGTQAMKFVCDETRKLNKKYINVWVFAVNTNSINFYKKCGFIADGKTQTMECGKTMECIRMKKELE